MNPTRLVAVYRSRSEAEDVAAALRRAGVADEEVTIGAAADQSAAAVAEQREEMGEAWSVAPSAVMTKEQAQGASTAMPVGVVIGAVLGLGIGLLLPDSMPLLGRLLLGAGIGGLFGGVVTMVIGAGLGARGPAVPGAAQGTPLSVTRTDAEVRKVLEAADFVRIDLVEGATSTVIGTEDRADGGVDRLRERLHQAPEGDWSSVAPEQPRADERSKGSTES